MTPAPATEPARRRTTPPRRPRPKRSRLPRSRRPRNPHPRPPRRHRRPLRPPRAPRRSNASRSIRVGLRPSALSTMRRCPQAATTPFHIRLASSSTGARSAASADRGGAGARTLTAAPQARRAQARSGPLAPPGPRHADPDDRRGGAAVRWRGGGLVPAAGVRATDRGSSKTVQRFRSAGRRRHPAYSGPVGRITVPARTRRYSGRASGPLGPRRRPGPIGGTDGAHARPPR